MRVGQTVQEWIETIDRHFVADKHIQAIKDVKIVQEFDGTTHAFPQTTRAHRNVFVWMLLEDGTSIGWNESPRSGWSFPRSSKNITKKYIDFFKEKGI